jgi:arylsulfatase A-like enzyme
LDLTQKTIADHLKGAGYATAWIGKSHLGYEPQFHPNKRGFDYFFGFLGGAHGYMEAGGEKRDPIQRNGVPVEKVDYLTDALAQEAAGFIEKTKGGPWFTYLAFNAVHAPLDVIAKYSAPFTSIQDPKRQKFAALLTGLDAGVGTVLQKIRDLGQEENTLIFFISDNGGPTPSTTAGNGPLRGYKAQTWEGGIRVPWFMQWKGQIPAGKVDDRPVIQIDILPTALAAAGVETKGEWKLDGVNLLPYVKGENTGTPHEGGLFWRFGQQVAVRKGDWKLVKAAENARGGGPGATAASMAGAQLYHLGKDIGEQSNLADKEPEKVKELTAAWDAWNTANIPAKWGGAGGGPRRNQQGARQQRKAKTEAPTPAQSVPKDR